MSVNRAITETVCQTILGFGSGTFLDSIFPEPRPITSTTKAVIVAIEVTTQALVDALVIALYNDLTFRKGFGKSSEDPTKGLGIIATMLFSQTKMGLKVISLKDFVKAKFRELDQEPVRMNPGETSSVVVPTETFNDSDAPNPFEEE